jgi:DNA-binding transcriptional MerR regulator
VIDGKVMENHDRQQVAEVYTISQVAELTGVPENTIRSWERRFGLPSPTRTAGKQRRYTQSDVDLIQAIQGSRDAGRTMDQAIADAMAGNNSSSPSHLTIVQPRTNPVQTDSELPDSQPLSGVARRLVEDLAGLELSRANSTLADAHLSMSVEAVAHSVLLPALRTLREMHLTAEIDHTSWLLGSQWIERKLLSAYESSNPESGDLHVVVVELDGESDPAALALGTALSRGGFRTTFAKIGAALAVAGELVATARPDCVLLHATTAEGRLALQGAARKIATVRTEQEWKGLLAIAGEVTTMPDTPSAIPIGDDTVHVAIRLRRALASSSSDNEDFT